MKIVLTQVRDFLLPRKKAVLANEQNVRQLEHEKAVITARQAKLKGSAEQQAKAVSSVNIKITRKVGEQEKLFGSVTTLDIAEALAAQGQKVDRRQIHLLEPIKAIGSYEVELRLHKDVTTKIKLTVAAE